MASLNFRTTLNREMRHSTHLGVLPAANTIPQMRENIAILSRGGTIDFDFAPAAGVTADYTELHVEIGDLSKPGAWKNATKKEARAHLVNQRWTQTDNGWARDGEFDSEALKARSPDRAISWFDK